MPPKPSKRRSGFSLKEPCPCFSSVPYGACCAPFHKGVRKPSPPQLMRARYCAYALGRGAYIAKTTHPSGPHHRTDTKRWLNELTTYARETRFTGLSVLDHTVEDDGLCAYVTFDAQLFRGTHDLSFRERSSFLHDEMGWRYLDGVVTRRSGDV